MSFGERVARPNTLVFQVPEALRAGSKEDFVAKLVSALEGHVIDAVQFVPGYHVRLTFTYEDSRHSVFRDGLVVDGVSISLFEADSTVRFVHLHHCPTEVPDDDIESCFSEYGSVFSVERTYFDGTDILTGSRIIKMSLSEDIPSKFYVLRYPCRVWYRDQPLVCFICNQSNHRAAECPLRGLCRNCHLPGHIARNCPGIPDDPVIPADVPLPADVPSDDASPAAASDSELCSGDEEVLQSAGDVSLSPRRTRSSGPASHVPPDSAPDVPVSVPASPSSTPSPAVRRRSASPAVNVMDSADDVVDPVSVAHFRSKLPSVPSPFSEHVIFPAVDGSLLVAFDFRQMTRRICDDTATFELFRECYYLDRAGTKYIPSMSLFPADRGPLPSTLLLDPSVPPSAFPVPKS